MEEKADMRNLGQTLRDTSPKLISHEKSAWLAVLIGRDAGKRFELAGARTTIGRSGEADITVDDERVSRVHCAVLQENGEVAVEDCGSRNGTFVDGERIDRRAILPSSNVQVGQTVLHLEYRSHADVRLEDDLRRQATTDLLTGALNRREFMRRANELLAWSRRSGMTIGVGMLDIDNFKKINDSYGHAAGDTVLKHVASAITEEKRSDDLLGRYGGDEFVVVLCGTMSSRDARLAFERLRGSISRHPVLHGDLSLTVTASMGVQLGAAGQSLTLDQMIESADRALYRAKQAGRNRTETTE